MNQAATRSTAAALAGLVVTAVVALVPSVYFAYRAPEARAMLETAVALVGTLVALLCLGRARRQQRLGDLAIVWAATIFALAYPVFIVVHRLAMSPASTRAAAWAPVVARTASAALLAAAPSPALARVRPSTRSLLRRLGWVALGVAALAALIVLVWIAPREALLRPELSERPHPFADPLVFGVELAAAALFALAAIRFARATQTPDPFVAWLATGCALVAVASVDYALFPSLSLNWLYVGDGLRAAAVAAWAIGATDEIVSYWSQIARLARIEERRRLARDLHDGLAQELAFLASHAQAPPAARAEPEWLVQLVAAADRALAESRRAIAALVADTSPSLAADLSRTATEIAGRYGASVDLDVAPSSLDPAQQETLVRIVREAVTNAIRHGRASRISVQLTDGTPPVLRVHDDGVGFEPAVPTETTGFGLVSMRERAATLGASLAVRSAPGEGTTVEVVWP